MKILSVKVIDKAGVFEALDRIMFFIQVNRAYERMLSDPMQRVQYEREIGIWDKTLLDGLEV